MSASPPTTLGKYQIIREIARSNDIVYEAYDPLMNRRVAIKELAMPGGSSSQQKEERVRRFEREVKAAGSLAHPNIVTIYEVGEDAGRHFMAMEYLDGHTLRNELDTHGFLAQSRAVDIAHEVLQALDFAHSRGVIHRDIKPENIQLLEDGRVKITDFGIARLTFEPNLTIDGQVFGTPSYMSPEQVVGKDIDARSDIFSMGIVLYEMVSGQKPFSGDSVVSITYAIMNRDPDQPAQANYAMWQVLMRALDKSPALRFSTAKEMSSALDEVKRSLEAGSVVIDPLAQATGQPYTTYPGLIQPPPLQMPFAQASYPGMPPPSYPYNPYQQQPYPGSSYQPPGLHQTPLPIYYPPPPRQPLLKPEQKLFLSRLFFTFLIMGTLVVLCTVGINSLSDALERLKTGRPPASARVEVPPRSRDATTSDSTSRDEKSDSSPTSGGTMSDRDDPVGAQASYDDAIALERQEKWQDARSKLRDVQAKSSRDSELWAKAQRELDGIESRRDR